jgi:hypothetical protein
MRIVSLKIVAAKKTPLLIVLLAGFKNAYLLDECKK